MSANVVIECEETDAIEAPENLNRGEFESYLPLIMGWVESWKIKASAENYVALNAIELEHAVWIVKHAVIAFIESPAAARTLIPAKISQEQLFIAQRCTFAVLIAMSKFCDTMFKDPFLAEYANAQRQGRKPERVVFQSDFRVFLVVSKFVRDFLNEIIDRRIV